MKGMISTVLSPWFGCSSHLLLNYRFFDVDEFWRDYINRRWINSHGYVGFDPQQHPVFSENNPNDKQNPNVCVYDESAYAFFLAYTDDGAQDSQVEVFEELKFKRIEGYASKTGSCVSLWIISGKDFYDQFVEWKEKKGIEEPRNAEDD